MLKTVNCDKIPIFRYCKDDFNYSIDKRNDFYSPFDNLLIEKWKDAERKGIFKYVLNINKEKILEGDYRFLAQLNLDRGEKRRRPENIASMSQGFDPELFNFTKISDGEILLDVGNGDGNDILAANISPIEKYHSLLITERFECLPQRVTKYSLRKAVDILLLSNSPYFRTIFNSLCAHASVNHLHWHLYYLKHEMPLESKEVQQLRGPIFELVNFPAKGFCLKLSYFINRDVDCLVYWTYFIVDYLQTHDIAHNIYITRARESNAENFDIYNDLRIYIWARKSSAGVKNTCDFVPAVCELFGHLSIKSEQGYEELSEDAVAEVLNDITSNCFLAVKDEILRMKLDEEELKN